MKTLSFIEKTNISLNFRVKMVSKVRSKYKSEEMRLMGRFIKCFQSTEERERKNVQPGEVWFVNLWSMIEERDLFKVNISQYK